MKFMRALHVVLITAVVIVLSSAGPASAGKWSGSTPDNGMGQSVSVEGQSTEKVDPADPTGCTIIYESTSTTTVTDNASGKVVSKKTTTRSKKYKKKNCPKGKVAPFVLIESHTTAVTVSNNPDGTSTVNTDDQQTNPGGKKGYKHTESTEKHDKADGKGNVTGGSSKTTEYSTTGGKTTKKVTGKTWDATKGAWVETPTVVAPLRVTNVSPMMPASASIGGYAQGELLVSYVEPDGTSGQTVASADVVIAQPQGKHFNMKDVSYILLAGADLLRGKLIAAASGGRADVQVDGTPGTQPTITQPVTPPVVTEGTNLTVSGSDLATGDGPSVLLCTKEGCDYGRITTASDTQLRADIPMLAPGPCSLTVENGAGKFSKPETINPVGVQLVLPKAGTVGQTLDAEVRLVGLMPENLHRTMQATVNLLGPGTFEGGGLSVPVTIIDGVAHVKIKANAAGVIHVNVRDVH